MKRGAYVFSQIMGLVSHKKFQTIVNQHLGDYKVRDFTCWKQYLCMAFGQLTHRESLSDTMLCLKANAGKLNNLMSLFKQWVIGGKSSPSLATVRFKCIALGSYIVHRGRSIILKIAAKDRKRDYIDKLFVKLEQLEIGPG
jgi:hypothetical protein